MSIFDLTPPVKFVINAFGKVHPICILLWMWTIWGTSIKNIKLITQTQIFPLIDKKIAKI